jgi:predicted ribosomally synthesized peptide with SipW-like signal peptide
MTMTAATASTSARSSVRKWVVTALVVGAAATIAGAGTFASFSASTSNNGNVFSTGRIELSNTKQAGTTCVSGHTGPGGAAQASLDTNDNTCDSLINLTLAKPGGAAQEGRVALANTGDYNGLLQLFVPGAGCTNATVASPAGSGNLCNKLEVYIQETNSTYTTPVASCVFPFNAGAACNTSFSAASDSLADLASSATPAAPKPTTPITINTGVTKYFVVKVSFPSAGFDVNGNGADNAFQNRSAAFGLTWRLQEA